MNLDEAQRELARYEWMPDTELFVIERGPFDAITLMIKMKVEDVYNPGRKSLVAHQQTIPRFVTADDFPKFLQRCCHSVAVHESDEWLRDRRTGRPLFDPHERDR